MKIVSLFLAMVVGTISLTIDADDLKRSEIRRMIEENKIMPLQSILARYPEDKYGRLLDLEAERDDGIVIYELEFLQPNGRVLEIKVDASNGRLLEKEYE